MLEYTYALRWSLLFTATFAILTTEVEVDRISVVVVMSGMVDVEIHVNKFREDVPFGHGVTHTLFS